MPERINRMNDENLYQPKIHSDKIRGLYQLKLMTGLPMTVLVDLAIEEFLEKHQTNVSEPVEVYGKRDA
jgi:hypothetical protein